MDLYTPQHRNLSKFNDYMTETYVHGSVSQFSIELWNVHEAIIKKIPRTNNHVDGLNRRLNTQLPTHPHIFHFVEHLREKHIYQQHKSQELRVQVRKRKRVYDEIDDTLSRLLHQNDIGELSNLALAVECGRAIKTTIIKN